MKIPTEAEMIERLSCMPSGVEEFFEEHGAREYREAAKALGMPL